MDSLEGHTEVGFVKATEHREILAKKISGIKQKATERHQNKYPISSDAHSQAFFGNNQGDPVQAIQSQVSDSDSKQNKQGQSPYVHQPVYIHSNHKQQAQQQNKNMQSSIHEQGPSSLPSIYSNPQPPGNKHILPAAYKANRWVRQAAYAYDEDSGCFSTYEVEAKREARKEEHKAHIKQQVEVLKEKEDLRLRMEYLSFITLHTKKQYIKNSGVLFGPPRQFSGFSVEKYTKQHKRMQGDDRHLRPWRVAAEGSVDEVHHHDSDCAEEVHVKEEGRSSPVADPPSSSRTVQDDAQNQEHLPAGPAQAHPRPPQSKPPVHPHPPHKHNSHGNSRIPNPNGRVRVQRAMASVDRVDQSTAPRHPHRKIVRVDDAVQGGDGDGDSVSTHQTSASSKRAAAVARGKGKAVNGRKESIYDHYHRHFGEGAHAHAHDPQAQQTKQVQMLVDNVAHALLTGVSHSDNIEAAVEERLSNFNSHRHSPVGLSQVPSPVAPSSPAIATIPRSLADAAPPVYINLTPPAIVPLDPPTIAQSVPSEDSEDHVLYKFNKKFSSYDDDYGAAVPRRKSDAQSGEGRVVAHKETPAALSASGSYYEDEFESFEDDVDDVLREGANRSGKHPEDKIVNVSPSAGENSITSTEELVRGIGFVQENGSMGGDGVEEDISDGFGEEKGSSRGDGDRFKKEDDLGYPRDSHEQHGGENSSVVVQHALGGSTSDKDENEYRKFDHGNPSEHSRESNMPVNSEPPRSSMPSHSELDHDVLLSNVTSKEPLSPDEAPSSSSGNQRTSKDDHDDDYGDEEYDDEFYDPDFDELDDIDELLARASETKPTNSNVHIKTPSPSSTYAVSSTVKDASVAKPVVSRAQSEEMNYYEDSFAGSDGWEEV
eukprot:gene26740-32311_t